MLVPANLSTSLGCAAVTAVQPHRQYAAVSRVTALQHAILIWFYRRA